MGNEQLKQKMEAIEAKISILEDLEENLENSISTVKKARIIVMGILGAVLFFKLCSVYYDYTHYGLFQETIESFQMFLYFVFFTVCAYIGFNLTINFKTRRLDTVRCSIPTAKAQLLAIEAANF